MDLSFDLVVGISKKTDIDLLTPFFFTGILRS